MLSRQNNIWPQHKSKPRPIKTHDIEQHKERAFDWNTLMDAMIERFVVRDIAKDLGTSKESRHAADPRFVYFAECRAAVEPARSLLTKIQAGRLML